MRMKLLGIVVLLGALLLARLYLPYGLLHYVVKQVNKIPEYRVKIADLDVHLIAGNYIIKNIELWKITNNIPLPFFKSEQVMFTLQWRSLLKGKIVGAIVTDHSTINFVTDNNKKNEQLGISGTWLAIVKSLFPVNINEVTIHRSEINLKNLHGNPPYNLYLKNIELTLQNIQNVNKVKSTLSSNISAHATAMGDGKVELKGSFNPFRVEPTFYLTLTVNTVDIREVNSFLKHYTDVKAKRGQFSCYIEAAATEGHIKGYVKPFIKNIDIEKSKSNPLQNMYESAVSVAAKILENPKKKSIATQINFSGNVNDPNTSFLSIVGYLLRNAFIQALVPQVDHDIRFQDIH